MYFSFNLEIGPIYLKIGLLNQEECCINGDQQDLTGKWCHINKTSFYYILIYILASARWLQLKVGMNEGRFLFDHNHRLIMQVPQILVWNLKPNILLLTNKIARIWSFFGVGH